MVLTLLADLARIAHQIESVTDKHRAMARRILSAEQPAVLVRLEEAFELVPPRWEAIDANHFADASGYRDAILPFELVVLGGIEEINGHFGAIPVSADSATSDQGRGVARRP